MYRLDLQTLGSQPIMPKNLPDDHYPHTLPLKSKLSEESIYTRATSHTRLRARDHYTSSTLIGVKNGAGRSLFRTTIEGPTEHVNARWM
jgi:hypothetical protein